MSIQQTYDRVADQYAKAFFDELSRKPFDRDLLDRFAINLTDGGRVCDIGCGPGQVARYLSERGVDAFGLDVSPELVRIARRLSPNLQFIEGNMLALPFDTASLGGITAFYSIIHLERGQVVDALHEFRRVLKPSGWLLVAFHGGTGEIHTENWFDAGVAIDATLFSSEEISATLQTAGFEVVETMQRLPYEFEFQSQRVYVLARNP